MIEDEKKKSHSDSTVIISNLPMPHPPLTQRDKKKEDNRTIISAVEANNTENIPEGAEYISPQEQRKREKEANLSILPNEELSDDQIIPQDEIDNYEDAVTIPLPENTTIPTAISTNPFNHPSLGTPISNQKHPTLGTPIGDSSISPF
jgi:hypothetical protein